MMVKYKKIMMEKMMERVMEKMKIIKIIINNKIITRIKMLK